MRGIVASSIALLSLAHAASLNDVPSVKLHVIFKRKSMNLHGHSEFDIYATPVVADNGASVLYNSYATFNDDDSEFTYTLVDGSAYLTTTDASDVETVQCLPSNTLPFDEILPALNMATSIPSASIGGKSVDCESGKLFKTTFAGSHYAICASGEAGFTAYSSDLDITVEYLDGPVSISKPELTDESTSCEVVQEATSLTPTALALATGSKIPSSTSRKLREESHMAMAATDMASDYLMDICDDENNNIAAGLFEIVGQCPMPKSRKSTTYQGGKHTSPSIDAAYVAAQEAYRKNVAAAMCSDSFLGLLSTYQAPCILAGTAVPHKSKKNDGLVEFQSCLGGLDENLFGNHYLDRFYRPQLNHADTAFLTGEGILKDSQKPHKWFECLAL
ncbi:RNA polymerase II transcription factor B subunit 2 [Phytophthora nicotianae]|uniref:RNA polymerase II transcription factor B subunit 2 n=1 Tax=Phytophthora nicotianae TaxID=4792 RepID=A0A0W8D6X0_PHYNI|nr:RNA polymerase II transcription factor B subunit 2 [Phytophthora nicotianae]